MKLLSDATEYALRAVVWLADKPAEPQTVQHMAHDTQASPGYLVKVLQQLGRAGIVSSKRGSHGGFTLERDPRTLSILDIINAADPLQRIHTCPLGLKSHGSCLCPLHRKIDDAIARIEEAFASTTVADLLEETNGSKPLCDTPRPTSGHGLNI